MVAREGELFHVVGVLNLAMIAGRLNEGVVRIL